MTLYCTRLNLKDSGPWWSPKIAVSLLHHPWFVKIVGLLSNHFRINDCLLISGWFTIQCCSLWRRLKTFNYMKINSISTFRLTFYFDSIQPQVLSAVTPQWHLTFNYWNRWRSTWGIVWEAGNLGNPSPPTWWAPPTWSVSPSCSPPCWPPRSPPSWTWLSTKRKYQIF